jgi:alpha-1,2-mannosyltransferase
MVLWTAIRALQQATFGKKDKKVLIYVYSGSQMSEEEILDQKVEKRFDVVIDRTKLKFIQISPEMHDALNPKNYPSFTMVWQALAYIRVVFSVVSQSPCDVFVDTMGVGFSFPFLKTFFGLKVYSYTHYPFISRDMINTVQSGKEQYNNKNASQGGMLQRVKLVYYWAIYYFYKFCGSFCDKVSCNSSWTRGHMDELWGKQGDDIKTIYPPCDTSAFAKINIDDLSRRENIMISFA